MFYRVSNDSKVVAAGIEVCNGKKWKESWELQIAEERLKHKALAGTVSRGQTDLGFCHNTHI